MLTDGRGYEGECYDRRVLCLSRRLCLMEITKDIRYIGVDDHDIDLFEGQYDVSGERYGIQQLRYLGR